MSSPKKSTPKSRFLASLSEETLEKVFERSSALSSLLGDWAAVYPGIMRAVRVPQLGLTLAAAAPFIEPRTLLPGACLSMWFFAVDDMLDEGTRPAEEVWPLLEQCPSLIQKQPETEPGEPLLAALEQIRWQLEQPDRAGFFEPLRADLAGYLKASLEAMRLEHQWSVGGWRDSLTLSAYFEASLHSVGVLPVYVCMLAAMGDETIPSRLPQLREQGRRAAMKIRLANDLRSYEREMAQGKPNSIGLLQREIMRAEKLDEAAALGEARLTVKAWLVRGMPAPAGAEIPGRASHRAEEWLHLLPSGIMAPEVCVAPAPSSPGGQASGGNRNSESTRPEHYATNLTAFVCDFYAHHDYHHPLNETGWS